MTVWEKTLVNLQKGYDRLMSFAATASERVKAEITIVRLQMQISDIRDKVGEQQRIIGQKLLEMKDGGSLPSSFDLLFRNGEISSALERIDRAQRDLEMLREDLRHAADGLKPAPPDSEEKSS
jgi:hypothetical protein